MGVASSTTNSSIELESTKVKELVFAARQGDWKSVFNILDAHPYLLNAIPEDRRWGVLHQAVWWNNEEILKKLLLYPTCDSRIQTKETTSEVGETGACTPFDVTTKYGYSNMGNILEQHSVKLTTEEELEDFPTFHYQNGNIKLQGLGLLRLTLAAYKQTFCPFTINQSRTITEILEDIFEYVNTNTNWLTVKEKVCDSLYTVCKPAVKVVKDVKTKDEFYQKIINVYTNENTKLYTYLNTALRRQEERSYRPTAQDLGLGPYVLMFHLLLMYWNKLEPEDGLTYRTILVKDRDCLRYQPGTQFVWLSFVSSSVDRSKAEPFPTYVSTGEHRMTFIIDNSAPSRWKPRNIEKFAQHHERERVYPAGAEYLVTDRSEVDGSTTIHMKLLDRCLAFAQTQSRRHIN